MTIRRARSRFARQGAEVPLLLRAGGGSVSLEAGCLPLGVLSGAEYTVVQATMEKGDTLLLVTDGVTEARQGRALWGYENMVLAAGIALQEVATLREAGESLLAQSRAFAGGAFQDDVCLLMARWEGETS